MIKASLSPGNAPHPGALFYLLALQLCEYSKKPYHGFTERGGRIKALLHGNKIHTVRTEYFFNEIKGISLGTGEPVQLIHKNQIKFICFRYQLLYARTLQVTSCISPVHVNISYDPVLGFTVRNQTFLLFADRISLLCLLQCGDPDIKSCTSHSGIPSSR